MREDAENISILLIGDYYDSKFQKMQYCGIEHLFDIELVGKHYGEI